MSGGSHKADGVAVEDKTEEAQAESRLNQGQSISQSLDRMFGF